MEGTGGIMDGIRGLSIAKFIEHPTPPKPYTPPYSAQEAKNRVYMHMLIFLYYIRLESTT